MDEVDEAIAALLEADGRLTHREIARSTGLSRSTAATRVQRLIASGQVVIRGAVHPAVLGRGALAHASLHHHRAAQHPLFSFRCLLLSRFEFCRCICRCCRHQGSKRLLVAAR